MGESTETLFYDSQVADLVTAIAEPKLKLELSKAGTLEFKIVPTHPNYNDFHKLSTYVRVELNGEELFRGRVLNIEDNVDLERSVTCEGDLAYLVDSLQPPDKTFEKDSTKNQDITVNNSAQRNSLPADLRPQMPADSKIIARANLAEEKSRHETPAAHFARYINNHNSQVEEDKRFRVGNITIDGSTTEEDFSASGWRDTKDAFDSDLIKYHGGFLQTRAAQDGGLPYVDYLKEPILVSSQPIMFGINVVELTEQFKGEDIFTVFVPIGKDGLTIASINDGSIGIEIADGVQKYGRIYKTESYSSATTPSELMALGLAYIDANYKIDPFSVTVKALDISMIDSTIGAIHVGSTVTVVSQPHGLRETLTCTSIEYDIQNPENNEYEIGDPSETLSQKNLGDKQETEAAVSTASARSSYSIGAGYDIQAAVNRQAATIADQADSLYSLTADTIKINAKTIEVEADLIEIKSKAIHISSDTVEITANTLDLGNVKLDGTGDSDYACYIIGDTMLYGNLSVGGWLNADLQNGDLEITDGYISGATSIQGDTIIYGENNQDLGDAVVAFGTPVPNQDGTITIPYTTADGDNTHELTFRRAATPLLIGGWSNGKYEVTSNPAASNRAFTEIYGIHSIGTPTAGALANYINVDVEAVADVPDQGDWTDGTVIYTERLSVDASSVANAVKVAGPTWANTPSASITYGNNVATFSTNAPSPSASTNKTLSLYSSVERNNLTSTFWVSTDSADTSKRIIKRTSICSDTNLVAGNIKNGVTIFGVTGTYSGGGSAPLNDDCRLQNFTWHDSGSVAGMHALGTLSSLISQHKNDRGYIFLEGYVNGGTGPVRKYYITIG